MNSNPIVRSELVVVNAILIALWICVAASPAAFALDIDPGGSASSSTIQAMVNRACAGTVEHNRPKVGLRAGIYQLERPILVNCNSVEMAGLDGRNAVVLHPTYLGPAIILEPKMTGVHEGPPLAGGSGHSFDTDGGNSVEINLRDYPYVELDGLHAFTVEAFFRQRRTALESAHGTAMIVSSGGYVSNNKGSTPGNSFGNAFLLGVSPDQSPVGMITINGVKVTLTGDLKVSLNAAHHIVLSYDSQMARLYFDGRLVSSRTVSGVVSQTPFENVMIGPSSGQWPEGSAQNASIDGYIGSVRLSNSVRYSGDSALVPSKLAGDSSTLALVNFDINPPGITKVIGPSGQSGWLPVRRWKEPDGHSVQFAAGFELHGFTMNGGGIFGWLATVSRYHNLACEYCDYGFYFAGNSYESHFDEIYDGATSRPRVGRFGLMTQINNGGGYSNLTLNNSTFPLVASSGSGVYTNILISPGNGNTIYGATFIGSQASINRIYFDSESPSSTWVADLLASNAWAPITVIGSEIDSPSHGAGTPKGIAPIVQDGGAPVILIGTSFAFSAGYPSLIFVNKEPMSPITAIGITSDGETPLRKPDGQMVVIGSPSFDTKR